jgi:(S)-2-hydroxyglutarate dehydrogenase
MGQERFQIIIIGGGIIGLSTAKALLQKHPGLSLLLIEKETSLAAHQTGHNSGVIHSGIYYKPGSLKARLCVEGGREMVEFCRDHRVPHRITGKVVVAVDQQEIPQLEELRRRGLENGVTGVKMLVSEELREIEPQAAGLKALQVPGTGIVDYSAVCQVMAEQIQAAGGVIKKKILFEEAKRIQNGWVVLTDQGDFEAGFLINCGGLQSDRIARDSGFVPPVKIVPFRGEYYKLVPEAESFVRGLIYPVPNPLFPFLGVHFTQMIGGGVEAGPNAILALKREGYRKSDFNFWDTLEILTYPGFRKMAFRYSGEGLQEFYRSFFKSAFVKALQRLVPGIQAHQLIPGGSGVRAQALDLSGSLVDDFKFLEAERVLHVLNAPSPAATSSLPIGRMIAEKVLLSGLT